MSSDQSAADALAKPELAPLWNAARQRLERNGRTITSSPVRLVELTDGEVAAICGLLSRRRPDGNDMRVNLVDLDSALRAGPSARGLIETLEAISGPVLDRRAERTALAAQRAELWSTAASHPVAVRERVRRWLDSLRRRGRIARLPVDDPIGLLNDALDGLEWLLTNRGALRATPLPLSVVAAQQQGDAHAFDLETPLGAVLTDAVCELSGLSDARAAWADIGVHLDRVSSSALTFMLPGVSGSLAGAARAAGEPLRVTHRMVERGFGLDLASLDEVWMCENPAVLSLAAEQLGQRCRPLVCLEGMPSSVTAALLGQLESAGVELHVHADLDLGGIAITAHLIQRFTAKPWRMGTGDYLAALAGPTTELVHTIGDTPWDPQLGPAMNAHRRAVHEEAIYSTLLGDLLLPPRSGGTTG